jgi:trimethylamine:corrinoid methyltransferase-like protein
MILFSVTAGFTLVPAGRRQASSISKQARYRDSVLNDLYQAARLADALQHVHFFSRSLVARDMSTPEALE